MGQNPSGFNSSQSNLANNVQNQSANIRYRVTIQDEDGVVRLQSLFDPLVNPYLRPIKPQVARVLYSALTTSYLPIMSANTSPCCLQVFNSLSSASNIDIGLSLDGSTDHWRLESGDGFSLDARSDFLQIVQNTVVYAKYYTSTGYVQPTGGTLRVVLL